MVLAYTALHHLLLELAGRPLVMTSGNRSEEPIAIGNPEARSRLGSIADGFLLHDREIVSRYDDSVVRLAGNAPVMLRRARGYAPLPLPLPVATPIPLVAVGPHLKNTFTLAVDDRAYPSQHIGDLETLETLQHFEEALARLRRLFSVSPEVAVRDLHPGYFSTRVAEAMGLGRVIPVQHHHAHVAAVMAEHGRTAPVLGVAYDGTGYGDDGRIWGGELLACDLSGYRRLAHLRYVPIPGGDLGARTPWRAAAGYLAAEPSVAAAFRLAFAGVPAQERAVAERQAAAGVNAPLASSMGRLFDAAAAVLGLRRVSDYEGQAAMELEALAGRRVARECRCEITGGGDEPWVLDPIPLLVELGERRQSGEDPADLAADFHASIAWATAELVQRACLGAGLKTVVLARRGVPERPTAGVGAGATDRATVLEVLLPSRLGPNDGAVSYGQAAVAAARLQPKQGGKAADGRRPCAWAYRDAFWRLRDDRGLVMGTGRFRRRPARGLPAYVADQVRPGDYVVVHVGFAISRVDEAEARRTFEVLREMSQLEELDWMREVAEQSLAAGEGSAHEIPQRIPRRCGGPGAHRDGSGGRATRPWVLMEVCGGQTHTIVRQGLDRAAAAGRWR